MTVHVQIGTIHGLFYLPKESRDTVMSEVR